MTSAARDIDAAQTQALDAAEESFLDPFCASAGRLCSAAGVLAYIDEDPVRIIGSFGLGSPGRGSDRLGSGRVAISDLISDREGTKEPPPCGSACRLQISVELSDSHRLVLLLLRPFSPFQDCDRAAALEICLLAARHIGLADRETRARMLLDAKTEVLDRLDFGVAVLDRDGRPMALNHVARRLINPGNEGTAAWRRLLAHWPGATQQSGELSMVRVTAPPGGLDGDVGIAAGFSIKPSYGAETCNRAPSDAVFLFDTGRDVQFHDLHLQHLFGLSRTEAQILMQVVRGRNLDDIATTTRTSIHTVRTYLKKIFSKTGAHRQSDLVKLVLLHCGGLILSEAPQARSAPSPRSVLDLRCAPGESQVSRLEPTRLPRPRGLPS